MRGGGGARRRGDGKREARRGDTGGRRGAEVMEEDEGSDKDRNTGPGSQQRGTDPPTKKSDTGSD